MSNAATLPPPETFLPSLRAGDPLAAHWLRHVTLRLRREVAWLWHERGPTAVERAPAAPGALPPFADRLEASLDLSRHAGEKKRFFAEDETAAYLTRLIQEPPASSRRTPPSGSFSWVARELALTPVDCFLLALAVSPAADSAAGPVYAACLNDPVRTLPTLGLAQRLWDRPEELLPFASPAHPLFTHGLLPAPAATGSPWENPLQVHPLVAGVLLHPGANSPLLRPIAPSEEPLPPEADLAAARLRAGHESRLRFLPVIAPAGAPLAGLASALATRAELSLAAIAGPAAEAWLAPALTLAWLHGCALYLGLEALGATSTDPHAATPPPVPLPALPVTVFVGLQDRLQLKRLSTSHTLPPVTIAASSFHQRVAWWREHLPGAGGEPELAAAIADCARRFRYEKDTILKLCRGLAALGRPVTPPDLLIACRTDLDLGDLAQPVIPRFVEADLMLPPKQTRQLREVIHAMRALTTVHYEWGTGRAWSESGLSALFAGPPGTGKTMAAEVIAAELGLPLYRIDLSQVVNKYIGETEKNLRRLFDAAEASDVILFFDEADSLFGKRTEVKDAHDRYANLEVSYLLERMERFKGLAILATNRKRDLDEAFLRRLRFLIDFPLPGVEERRRIWRQVMPPGVDITALDFAFLAQRFPLSGGHIRSMVFHACLQAAEPGGPRRLTMEMLIEAVHREYDKLDRSISLEQYGTYAPIAERLL